MKEYAFVDERDADLSYRCFVQMPVILTLDVSGSMGENDGYIALNEAVASFYAACKNDAVNRYGYDVCVVTFGGDGVEVRQDFRPIWNQEQAPQFGRPEHGPYGTPLAQAVDVSIRTLEARLVTYRREHLRHTRSALLLVITDGQSTEVMRERFRSDVEYERSFAMYEATAERARDLQREGRLEVACVGVGEQDYERLADFSLEGGTLRIKDPSQLSSWFTPFDPLLTHVFRSLHLQDCGNSSSSFLSSVMQWIEDEGVEGVHVEAFSRDM